MKLRLTALLSLVLNLACGVLPLHRAYAARVTSARSFTSSAYSLGLGGSIITGGQHSHPTSPWPAARKTVSFGTLSLKTYEAQATGACNKINFDPNRVSDGVVTSNDPILKFRSPAYAVSFAKRSGEPLDPAPVEDARRPATTP